MEATAPGSFVKSGIIAQCGRVVLTVTSLKPGGRPARHNPE